MNDWRAEYAGTKYTLEEAVRLIPRGKPIFLGSGAAVPGGLVSAMARQMDRFSDNSISHIMTLGDAPYVAASCVDRFRHNALFIGRNVRDAVHEGRADYTPVFLSQVPSLIRSRRVPVDIALIQVTPPDPYGYVNLGVSVDVVVAALEMAHLIIAEINPHMPVVHGGGYLRMDRIHAWVEHPSFLPELKHRPFDDIDHEIGRLVATLVDNGSTIQVGIGALPEAILGALSEKRDLGIWSEMVSDGVVDLIEKGVVTGRYKTMHPGRVSASFALGSQRTYQTLNNNPAYTFQPVDIINDPVNIGRQHRMVAINGALQVDLTGQVCSDSIGAQFHSGIGGQVDFIRGASMCRGGRPLIALRSTAKDHTLSRIVAALREGAGVVTSRGDVHYVVTEYGIADLHGRSIRERTMALISIAHPHFRGELITAAKARRYVFSDQIEPRASYPSDMDLRLVTEEGGPIVIRPIRETDENKLAALFYSLSEDTIQRRYLAPLVALPHHQLMSYLSVDDRMNVALVVETEPGDDAESEIVGVARYHASEETRFADIAFLMRDDWQGRGIGKKLLHRLIYIAKANDLRGFTTEVLTSNRAMLQVFRDSGLALELERNGATYSVRIPFAPQEPVD